MQKQSDVFSLGHLAALKKLPVSIDDLLIDVSIMDKSDKDRVKCVEAAMGKVETKLYCHFVAFGLKPLNLFFLMLPSKLQPVRLVLCSKMFAIFSEGFCPTLFSLNFWQQRQIHIFDYENVANQLSNDEI